MTEPLSLSAHDQQLILLPALGGGAASWRLQNGGEFLDLWRPWPGTDEDPFTLAHFPLVPWANRIGGGEITVAGVRHPLAPTHPAERLPIHGEGWRQPWQVIEVSEGSAILGLVSDHFQKSPYAFIARQGFSLVPGGLDQWLEVRALNRTPLPYGLGLHPYFPRHGEARLSARVRGVWEPGPDLLPRRFLSPPPAEANPAACLPLSGPLLDQCYGGWDGEAEILWPRPGLRLRLSTLLLSPARSGSPGFCHIFRPAVFRRRAADFFCFEPVSHPPDAFHLEGRPGLISLAMGERLLLAARWRWTRTE